jgi:hypothetical protein
MRSDAALVACQFIPLRTSFAFALAVLFVVQMARAELGSAAGEPRPEARVAIPISVRLDPACLVTLVIEDSNGDLVRNLLAETPLPAGENTVYRDGYDDGRQKVFDPRGRLLRTIGKAGGPQIGRYDEKRMAHPCGLAVDAGGRLWVAEVDVPRRISLWDSDGAFVKAFSRLLIEPNS